MSELQYQGPAIVLAVALTLLFLFEPAPSTKKKKYAAARKQQQPSPSSTTRMMSRATLEAPCEPSSAVPSAAHQPSRTSTTHSLREAPAFAFAVSGAFVSECTEATLLVRSIVAAVKQPPHAVDASHNRSWSHKA